MNEETKMKRTLGSTWIQPVAAAKPMKHQPTRGRLRKAGAEIVAVLREATSRLTCRQFYRALPHVPGSTVRRRLTEMSSAGDLERNEIHGGPSGQRGGRPYSYEYGLAATLAST